MIYGISDSNIPEEFKISQKISFEWHLIENHYDVFGFIVLNILYNILKIYLEMKVVKKNGWNILEEYHVQVMIGSVQQVIQNMIIYL